MIGGTASIYYSLREAGVSANKVYAAHRISKKSQREVLEAAANPGVTYADVADLPDDEACRMLFTDRNNHESVFEESRREYGAPKMKMALAKEGVVASRRLIKRIMDQKGLVSAYAQKKHRSHATKVNEADVPNVLDREFNGYLPRTHIVSDLTYVRVGRRWNYVCPLIDLYNREIVGHAASDRKDAKLVKSAFATLRFPLSDIDVFHTDSKNMRSRFAAAYLRPYPASRDRVAAS